MLLLVDFYVLVCEHFFEVASVNVNLEKQKRKEQMIVINQ